MSLVPRDGAAEGASTLEGPHYHYVANRMYVPTSASQAREYGLDLNNNGTVDNQFGMMLSALASQGIDVPGRADKSVAEGGIILLVNLQTTNFPKRGPRRASRCIAGTRRTHPRATRVRATRAPRRPCWYVRAASITCKAAPRSRSMPAHRPTRRSLARSLTARSQVAQVACHYKSRRGATPYLAGELFKVEWVWVQYRSEYMPDLISGQVQAAAVGQGCHPASSTASWARQSCRADPFRRHSEDSVGRPCRRPWLYRIG
jgi:hypothetical protein